MQKAAVLTEALPYIQDFKGSIVLVKVGGSVMEVPENLEGLLTDIAFMNAVGMKTVLVHGGGKAISRGMEAAGIPPLFVMGLRVTTEDAVRVVERVIKSEVNANVVSLLQKHRANARPLHGDWIFGVEKKFGKGSLMKLGVNAATDQVAAIPTGSLALDAALGIGVIPRGRIIEIFGPESSG